MRMVQKKFVWTRKHEFVKVIFKRQRLNYKNILKKLTVPNY